MVSEEILCYYWRAGEEKTGTEAMKEQEEDKREGSEAAPSNFIRQVIDKDLETGKNDGRVVTRFPPEPNGYLHIGHAKSICLNFGLAGRYGGVCHLRFDDTNPTKEEAEYVYAIIEDVKWLGFDWENHLYYASDYFEKMYDFAVTLIKKGKAYVCSLSADEMREYRGTLTEPGRESPHRNRSVEENLTLFKQMRKGEFPDGSHVLRAKIDMASPNLNMRDPVLYRIQKANHHRTGDTWCIYPMYDFAHCLEDAIEGITHSICTLEFEDHRPLYDWVLDEVGTKCHPQQIEFARLNLSYTVMSKRKLLQLVNEGHVSGWDDPRMPTLAGLRRRGFPPSAVRDFCERIGVAKANSTVDIALLEHCVREELNESAPRAMGVLNPLKVIITNYPEGKMEEMEVPNHPASPEMGTRKVSFSKTIYIEADDFMEEPAKKFFRLAPGKEVRLRSAYFIKCEEVVKDETTGEIKELLCTYDPASRGGASPDGRKVKGTLHWVSVDHSVEATVRLYDRLFLTENPGSDKKTDFREEVNPDALVTLANCRIEPGLKDAAPGSRFQFERQGYFSVDSDSKSDKPVFNRIVPLRDTWGKVSGAPAR